MKRIITISVIGIITITSFLAGCNVSNRVAESVEKSYEVVTQGRVVLGIVSDKLEGTEEWDDASEYMESLENALSVIKVTLETLAPFVGAELNTDRTTTVSIALSDEEEKTKLDLASEKLIESIQQ